MRVLLATADVPLLREVEKQLHGYLVETCTDGDRALDLLAEFDPDVMLIDTSLNGLDCMSVLRAARGSGRTLGILAVTVQRDPPTLQCLADLGVNYILNKPCRLSAVLSNLVSLANYVAELPANGRCIENELDCILLDLGFRMGPGNYRQVMQAVLCYYKSWEELKMKELYYEVAQICGGTIQQKEKSIRDGIKSAYKRGNPSLWNAYFRTYECPTNENFVAVLAKCLHRGRRHKLPYQKQA